MTPFQGRFRIEPPEGGTQIVVGRTCFAFRHNLTSSPLLRLDALRALGAALQEQHSLYHLEYGERGPGNGWGSKPDGASVLDGFDALADGNALLILKSIHRRPEYGRLLNELMRDLKDAFGGTLAEPLDAPICTVILASPGRITPYHMDGAHNFLMQLQGTKAFHVFDGTDPDIVSDWEKDAFWGGDGNAAVLTEARQRKAVVHELGPGDGVHVPMTFPHWARNGPDVSVAVSVNFRPLRNEIADVHALNGVLRRRGLRPGPPGRSRVVDSVKIAAFRSLCGLKRITGRPATPT